VYYFWAYFRATRTDAERVDFAVPSGNFGNIYAGYVARRMGLPVSRLILASNENDVLDEFFRTGRYRVRRAVQPTSSPSMDISKASNFERYAFELVGRDAKRVVALWDQLARDGQFELPGASGFASGKSTHADRLATIRRVHERYGVAIDPHTADGVKVGLERRQPGVPLVCLETAQPAKFSATLVEALGREPARPAGFEGIEKLPQRVEVIMPDARAVKRIIEQAAQA
jgi:threonine synthase